MVRSIVLSPPASNAAISSAWKPPSSLSSGRTSSSFSAAPLQSSPPVTAAVVSPPSSRPSMEEDAPDDELRTVRGSSIGGGGGGGVSSLIQRFNHDKPQQEGVTATTAKSPATHPKATLIFPLSSNSAQQGGKSSFESPSHSMKKPVLRSSPFFPKTTPPPPPTSSSYRNSSARVPTTTVSSSPFVPKTTAAERDPKPAAFIGGGSSSSSSSSSSSCNRRLAQLQHHLQQQQQPAPVTPLAKQQQAEEPTAESAETNTAEKSGTTNRSGNGGSSKRVLSMIAAFEKSPPITSASDKINKATIKGVAVGNGASSATPTKNCPPPPPPLSANYNKEQTSEDKGTKVDPTTPQRLGGTYLYRVGGPELAARRNKATSGVGSAIASQDRESKEGNQLRSSVAPTNSGSTFSSTAINRIDARAKQFRAAPVVPPSNNNNSIKLEASRPIPGRKMMWSKTTSAPQPNHYTSDHKTTIEPPPPPPPPPLDFGDLSPIADNAYGSNNNSTRELQLPDSLHDDSTDIPPTPPQSENKKYDDTNIVTANVPVRSSSSSAARSNKVLLTSKHASTSSAFQNRLLQFSQQVAQKESLVYQQQPQKQQYRNERPSSPGPAERVPIQETASSQDCQNPIPCVSPPTGLSSSQHKVLSSYKHAPTQSSPFQNRLLRFSQKLSQQQQYQRDGSQQQQQDQKAHASKGLDPNLMPHACHSLEPTEDTSVVTSTEDDYEDDIPMEQIDEVLDPLELSLDDTRQPTVYEKQVPIPLAALCDLSIDLPSPPMKEVATESPSTSSLYRARSSSPSLPSSSNIDGSSSKVRLLKSTFEMAISSAISSSSSKTMRSPNVTAEISQEGFEIAANNVSGSTANSNSLNDAVPLDESPLVSDDEIETEKVVVSEPVVVQDARMARESPNLPPKAVSQHEPVHHPHHPSNRPVSLSWLSRKPSQGEGQPGGATSDDHRVPTEDRTGLVEGDPSCVFESYDGLSSTGQISVQQLASTFLTEEALIDSATSPRVMKEDLILLRSNRGSANITPIEQQRNHLPPGRIQKRLVSGVVLPASDLTDDASLEPPVTVRKTPPRADPFLMAELDFLAPGLVPNYHTEPSEVQLVPPATEPSEVRPGKMAPLRPNPRDTGRSKGRTRCGPDDSQGACPVSLSMDKPTAPAKSEPPQSRIQMLANVLASSAGVTSAQTEIAGISTASQGFPALAQEEYMHELPLPKASTAADPATTRTGPVDLDETVESSFEVSKDQSAFDIVDSNDEDPFQIDYAGLITGSASQGSAASHSKDPTVNPKIAPNPKDTGRSARSKPRSVSISTSPVAVASGSTLSPIMSVDGYSPQSSTSAPLGSSSAPESSPTLTSAPESSPTITSIDSPSKANPTFEDSPSWKVTKTISQTNPMWAALDSEERVRRWRRFRRRQHHEGIESSYDEEYESVTTSDQDSDVRSSSRDKVMSLDQQWQLFNPVDVNNPLVAYYEPNSVLRPRKIEKNPKRSTRPSRKSPRTLPATSGMMVEI